VSDHPPAAPSAFAQAAEELRATGFRDDFAVREIPAPSGLAPESLALAGDVRPDGTGIDSPFGTGRFILLHDPDEPEPWGGAWRIVCFAQAPLESEIGTDPLLADVAWSWLVDALASRGASYSAASGDGAQIELRASWSPKPPFGPHVEAWAELVCMLAGLPPGSEGIVTLGSRRSDS
jgi:hypothetical protein